MPHIKVSLIAMIATLAVAISVTCLSVPAQAQPEDKPEQPNADQNLAPIPFNFAPPGARSLGMGATFLAIADDATASEANPAGLTILTRPEVSVHYRSSSYEIKSYDPNAQFALDFSIFRPERLPSPIGTFDKSESDISFASYVHPFKKWVLSVYYQQATNFAGTNDFLLVDPVFIDLYRAIQERSYLLENFGVSAAFKIGSMVSLGLSVRQSNLELSRSDELRIEYFDDFEFISNPISLSHLDFFGAREIGSADDDDLTFNVGLLIKPSDKFSFGAVFKQGGEFEVNRRVEFFDCINFPSLGLTCDPSTRQGSFAFFSEEPLPATVFDVPEFYGVGIAWRPTKQLTIGVDVTQITYSDQEPAPENRIEGISEPIADEIEVHFGLEYTFLVAGNKPVSLRGGFWTDEDHDGLNNIDSDQTHYTVGLGFVVKSLQIDVAGHFSDNIDESLLSLVYRF